MKKPYIETHLQKRDRSSIRYRDRCAGYGILSCSVHRHKRTGECDAATDASSGSRSGSRLLVSISTIEFPRHRRVRAGSLALRRRSHQRCRQHGQQPPPCSCAFLAALLDLTNPHTLYARLRLCQPLVPSNTHPSLADGDQGQPRGSR